MSVTSELRASARSTYRLLFRTAASTFRGDERVLNAFREKVRNEFREGRSLADSSAYSARIQLGQEVADVLRRNVVQGVKAEQPSSPVKDESGVWRLRLTEDTELGSNDTIKSSPRPAPSTGRRQLCCQSESAASTPAPASAGFPSESGSMNDHEDEQAAEEEEKQEPPRKMNFSALRRASQGRVKPELNENDLEESFVRGSGPGGQSINKTSNNVQLLHKPTGIRVSCQETRSLQTNRMIARRNLVERLDHIANPGLSKEDMKRAKQVERERRRRKKAKKKAHKKSTGEAEEEE